MSTLRCYMWIHNKLNPVDRAVQAAHCASELALENLPMWKEWASKDKTMILYKAHNTAHLERVIEKLSALKDTNIPFAFFQEDHDTLGGLKTACCLVFPSGIVDLARAFPNKGTKLLMSSYIVAFFSGHGLIYEQEQPILEVLSTIIQAELLT